MTTARERRLGYLSWIAVCLIWGTTYLGIRICLESIPPALMGGLRWTLAGSLLSAYVLLRGEPFPPMSRWGSILLLGFLLLGLGNGGVVFAEQWVPSGLAAVLVATAPFWMASVEAALPDGERMRRNTVIGLLIGFSGILVLVWPDLALDRGSDRRFLAGVIALQILNILEPFDLKGVGALGTRYISGTETLFAGIHRLLPGYTLVYENGAVNEFFVGDRLRPHLFLYAVPHTLSASQPLASAQRACCRKRMVSGSPSAVTGWLLARGLEDVVVGVIGATTRAALERYRMPEVIAPEPSVEGGATWPILVSAFTFIIALIATCGVLIITSFTAISAETSAEKSPACRLVLTL